MFDFWVCFVVSVCIFACHSDLLVLFWDGVVCVICVIRVICAPRALRILGVLSVLGVLGGMGPLCFDWLSVRA